MSTALSWYSRHRYLRGQGKGSLLLCYSRPREGPGWLGGPRRQTQDSRMNVGTEALRCVREDHGTNKVTSGEDKVSKSPKKTGLCPRTLSLWEK